MGNSDNYIKLKKISESNPRIIISRTDNLGDVVLALPMAGAIRKAIPNAYIIFLGKVYTKDIIEMSQNVDRFVDWDEIKVQHESSQINIFKELNADYFIHAFPAKQIARLAKKARIPHRIGTTGRLYHWGTCNQLVRFSRRRSELHESQLNMKLLRPLGIDHLFSFDEIINCYNFIPPADLPDVYREMIDITRFNLILHPKSKGSAREWSMQNYSDLINILPSHKFKVFISGTESENDFIQKHLASNHPGIINIAGKLNLRQFISFIALADGMVACSTGPLHIAAALGKFAIGIYPPIKPMHPGRWAPVGVNASYLVQDIECNKCRESSQCECIENISPEMIKTKLMDIVNT